MTAAGDVELAEDMAQMCAHGVHADVQRRGDRSVVESACDCARNGALRFREPLQHHHKGGGVDIRPGRRRMYTDRQDGMRQTIAGMNHELKVGLPTGQTCVN